MFSQYVMRFLDLALSDPGSLRRHKLSRLLPDHWMEWAAWYGRNRNLAALSQSQSSQDLFALFILETHFGINASSYQGTFVEFGAYDGITHSNSYSLEKLGWDGIILEPDTDKFGECRKNRKCEAIHAAVVGNDGPKFVNFLKDTADGELSHVAGYGTNRSNREKVNLTIPTIALDDILNRLGHVDFLSIDTEGSEADILENSSFSVLPRIIVVEHNYDSTRRDRIRKRLASLSYSHVFRHGSHFDDYYVSLQGINTQ